MKMNQRAGADWTASDRMSCVRCYRRKWMVEIAARPTPSPIVDDGLRFHCVDGTRYRGREELVRSSSSMSHTHRTPA